MFTSSPAVDLCIVGAGSGGLSTAVGAARMGARVVLVEKGRMGGDCLNTGCVPSKALIAAAGVAHGFGHARHFGFPAAGAQTPRIDPLALRDHIHGVIGAIAPHDSAERMESHGIRVVAGAGRLHGRQEVAVGEEIIRARWVVLATGSRPAIPALPGLADTPFLTNETVFDLGEIPSHPGVIGGGPIGCELAAAWARLGARVTLFQRSRLLPRDDPDLADIIRKALQRDGVTLVEHAAPESVSRDPEGGIRLAFRTPQETGTRVLSHLLVATGRKPDIDELDLERGGVTWNARGIITSGRLLTASRRIFAIGDCTGRPAFTHAASHHAGIVIRNALLRLPARVRDDLVPHVTYTDPELAQVGMTADLARQHHGDRVRVIDVPFTANDRAHTEHATEGLIRVVALPNGRILGCGIAGRSAGELIGVWSLALSRRMKLSAIAGLILPYPTLGEISKRAAGEFYAPALFGPRMRRFVALLSRWPG